MTRLLRAWFDLLEAVIAEACRRDRRPRPLHPAPLATLVGLGFMGGESMMLLGNTWTDDVFAALHAVGDVLKLDREEP